MDVLDTNRLKPCGGPFLHVPFRNRIESSRWASGAGAVLFQMTVSRELPAAV